MFLRALLSVVSLSRCVLSRFVSKQTDGFWGELKLRVKITFGELDNFYRAVNSSSQIMLVDPGLKRWPSH